MSRARVHKSGSWRVVRVQELDFGELAGGGIYSLARLFCSDGVSRYGVAGGLGCDECDELHVHMWVLDSRALADDQLRELRRVFTSAAVEEAICASVGNRLAV